MLEPIQPNVPRNSTFEGFVLVCVNYAAFILSWCKVMENPHCCIPNVLASIVASSSSMTIPCGPYFLDFIIPFKLFEKFVRGMCQCLQDFFKEVYHVSTTSIYFFQGLNCPFASLL